MGCRNARLGDSDFGVEEKSGNETEGCKTRPPGGVAGVAMMED